MLTEIFLAAAVSVWQAQVERTRVRVVCTDTCIIDWCICTDNLCINTCAPLILIKGLLCSDFCVEFSGVISSLFCASTVSISLVCWKRRCKYTRPLKWGKMLLFESMLRNSFHSFLFTEIYQVHCFPPENQMQDMNASLQYILIYSMLLSMSLVWRIDIKLGSFQWRPGIVLITPDPVPNSGNEHNANEYNRCIIHGFHGDFHKCWHTE